MCRLLEQILNARWWVGTADGHAHGCAKVLRSKVLDLVSASLVPLPWFRDSLCVRWICPALPF
jgi:hypothetical protein